MLLNAQNKQTDGLDDNIIDMDWKSLNVCLLRALLCGANKNATSRIRSARLKSGLSGKLEVILILIGKLGKLNHIIILG